MKIFVKMRGNWRKKVPCGNKAPQGKKSFIFQVKIREIFGDEINIIDLPAFPVQI